MKRYLSTAGLIVAFVAILGSAARAQTETTLVTASEEVTTSTTSTITSTTVLTPPPIVIIVPPPTTTTTVVPTTTSTTSTTTSTTVVPTTTSTTTIPCISLHVIVGGWRPNTIAVITVDGWSFRSLADPDGLLDTTVTPCAVIHDGDSVSASGISFSGQRRTVVLGIQGETATEAAPSGGVGSVAFTGSDTLPLTLTGICVIAIGGLLVISTRLRRRTN